MFRFLIYLIVINVLVIDMIILLLYKKFKDFKFGGDLIDICSRIGKL